MLTPCLQIVPLGAHRAVLHALRPNFIVMYDADLELMREIEVYRASQRGLAVRVYFMVYDNSVDVQKYQHAVAREREAFQNLIRENSVPVSLAVRCENLLLIEIGDGAAGLDEADAAVLCHRCARRPGGDEPAATRGT